MPTLIAATFVALLLATPAPEAHAPAPGPAVPALASLQAVRAAIQAPGARAVLVNVWATWCDACRDELPALLQVYRDNRGQGLRLVMVSADDEDQGAEVARVLGAALTAAGLPVSSGVVSLLKKEDDNTFINGLDRRWSGALPATFLFDGRGERVKSWLAPITRAELEAGARATLTPAPPATKPKPQPQPRSGPRPTGEAHEHHPHRP